VAGRGGRDAHLAARSHPLKPLWCRRSSVIIPQTPPLYPRFVALTLAQCANPGSRATKLTPTGFRRRCASMLKHQEELKRQEERRSFRE
jgi:hypothetical protein